MGREIVNKMKMMAKKKIGFWKELNTWLLLTISTHVMKVPPIWVHKLVKINGN